jgi:hypothetical protein
VRIHSLLSAPATHPRQRRCWVVRSFHSCRRIAQGSRPFLLGLLLTKCLSSFVQRQMPSPLVQTLDQFVQYAGVLLANPLEQVLPPKLFVPAHAVAVRKRRMLIAPRWGETH